MKLFARMVWHCDPLPLCVLVDPMAAALTGQKEAGFLKDTDRIGSVHPGQLVRHTATSKDVRLMDSD